MRLNEKTMNRPIASEFLKLSTIQSNKDILKYVVAIEQYCDFLENDFSISFLEWTGTQCSPSAWSKKWRYGKTGEVADAKLLIEIYKKIIK